MHLLVAMHNNLQEWRDTMARPVDKPRLPLPYAFGAAFLNRGHRLSAVNLTEGAPTSSHEPFEKIYSQKDLPQALQQVDVAALWGGHGITAALKQLFLPYSKKRVILNSYVWQAYGDMSLRARRLVLATRLAALVSRATVLMTAEQAEQARAVLPQRVPIIRFRCGLDTSFYRIRSSFEDVPTEYRPAAEELLKAPYVIMPGDELRFNADALDLVERSEFRLVRISQYSQAVTQELRKEVLRRGITDRFFVFEGISYPFMRFLLQHASAYVGLVNATWQPAGWTVACEALASGLPVILYEGLVSRELSRLGVPDGLLVSIPIRDVSLVQRALQNRVTAKARTEIAVTAQRFAAEQLDFERLSSSFVMDVEKAMAITP